MSRHFNVFGALRRANPVSPESLKDPARSAAADALLEAILSEATQDAPPRNLSSVSWHGKDDAQLLNGALRDRDAFGVFYEQHALAVYRWFAYRVQREGTVAAELTGETFAEALRSLPRFEGTAPGSGTSWLFGIARNLARDHHRSRRVRDDARRDLRMPRTSAIDGSFQDAEDRIDSGRLHEKLEEAVAQLSPAQREAVTLRVVDELDYPSIAHATSTTEQAVRLRVSRGLRALRRQLAPATHEEES
jgi:RNA polymerase sigma factor (sigma-70 family)